MARAAWSEGSYSHLPTPRGEMLPPWRGQSRLRGGREHDLDRAQPPAAVGPAPPSAQALGSSAALRLNPRGRAGCGPGAAGAPSSPVTVRIHKVLVAPAGQMPSRRPAGLSASCPAMARGDQTSSKLPGWAPMHQALGLSLCAGSRHGLSLCAGTRHGLVSCSLQRGGARDRCVLHCLGTREHCPFPKCQH